jgi:hypothetical protein
MSKLFVGGLGALGLLLASVGCQTQFYGDPAFPGGAPACFKKCQRQNMEMASFVYVGEYSSACACKPRTASASVGLVGSEGADAAVVAAAAGVEMQRRRAAAQQSSSSAYHPPGAFTPGLK